VNIPISKGCAGYTFPGNSSSIPAAEPAQEWIEFKSNAVGSSVNYFL
jgi:hypothetical protein